MLLESLPNFALIGTPGWPEIVAILVLILIFFGPRKLPEVAEALGKSIRRFRGATRDIQREIQDGVDDGPAKTTTDKKESDPKGSDS